MTTVPMSRFARQDGFHGGGAGGDDADVPRITEDSQAVAAAASS